MAQTEGKSTRVIPMFMGTRADLAPNPLPRPVFAWDCTKCQANTSSVSQPPPDATLVCNVCVSQMTAQAEEDSSTQVMWGMTQELGESIRTLADMKGRPVEEVFNRFLEWKLGRSTKANLYNTSEKKQEK